jgi:hypothetical protein
MNQTRSQTSPLLAMDTSKNSSELSDNDTIMCFIKLIE